MGTATHGVRTSDECEGAMIHDDAPGALENPRAKTTSENWCGRKYEEHRDSKCDKDLKLQRLYGVLPKPIEQQLVLEDRDGSATFESVKRRANNWILMNSTGRSDMDLETMESGGDNEDDD